MKKALTFLVVFSAVAVMLLVLLSFKIDIYTGGNIYTYPEDFISDWKDEEGKTVSLFRVFNDESPDEIRSFTHTLDSTGINGRSLCMITHNINFSVYLDEQKIYEFKPKLGGVYGSRYGEAVHTIPLPSYSGEKTLKISAVSLRTDGTSGCNKLYLSDSRIFLRDIAEYDGLKFAFCILTFIFGVILFIIAIIEDRMCGKMIETVCLGAIALIVSTWIASQTLTMHFICHNPAMLRVLEYNSLNALPIPVLTFSAAYTHSLKNRAYLIITFGSAVHTVGTFILVCLKVIDYSNHLIITHIIIALGVILIIYLIIKSIIKKVISRSKGIYIISAMSMLMLGGIADMLRYYVRRTETAFITVVGLIVFTTILAIYEYHRIIDMQVKASKTELMQTIAMEDALTGLGSRAAFVAYENEIMKRNEGSCLFIHFDVNNLKKVNDVYGHAEGDKHIIATANVLRESFGDVAKIFRVGGDEFFAVLDHDSAKEMYVLGVSKLIKAQQAYNEKENPPVLLAIAYGMAEYDYSLHNPETAERLADSRMYEEKRRMKAATVLQTVNI